MRENAGRSIAIAAIAAFGYAIWAWVLVAMLWLAVTIYAFVKWAGAPQDHPSGTTLLVVTISVVMIVPLTISLGIYLVARKMRPPKRADAGDLSLAAGDEDADG
jgi:ABC-type Na+ efflux pump permease subunit